MQSVTRDCRPRESRVLATGRMATMLVMVGLTAALVCCRSPLHEALIAQNSTKVHELLSNGANPNELLPSGAPPLYLAAQAGDVTSLQILLDHGALTSMTFEGWTPMHVASQNGCLRCVDRLLQHGADVNARSDRNVTSLHLAAKTDKGWVVAALLDAGANPNARDDSGWTPLNLAAYWSREVVARQLLVAGAQPSEIPNDPDATARTYMMAAHYARRRGDSQLARQLYGRASAEFTRAIAEYRRLLQAAHEVRMKAIDDAGRNRRIDQCLTSAGETYFTCVLRDHAIYDTAEVIADAVTGRAAAEESSSEESEALWGRAAPALHARLVETRALSSLCERRSR